MPLPTEEQLVSTDPSPGLRAGWRQVLLNPPVLSFMVVGATEAPRGAGICSQSHSLEAARTRTQVP